MFAKLKSTVLLAIVGTSLLLAGCVSDNTGSSPYGDLLNIQLANSPFDDPGSKARNKSYALRGEPEKYDYDAIYAAVVNDDEIMNKFDYTKMNSKYLRQQVRYFGSEAPGTIVIDASGPLLYFIQPNGMAIRYGIGVGKEGFGWTGTSNLQRKTTWPTWTPPAEMIARSPELAQYANGMPGGIDNPLGARAMYLYKDGKDTLYRIHGTSKPFSIGKKVSSGCFRMINQDAADLYARVEPGANVFVRDYLTQLDTK